MNLVVKNFSSQNVVLTRHIGKYQGCKIAWDFLIDWQMKANFQPLGAIGIGYDNPDVIKDCRYDACFILPENFDDKLITGNVKVQKINAIEKCITAIHKGSYAKLGEFYDEFFKSLNKNSYEINLPCYEMYLNSPVNTKEEDLLTEVYIKI